MAKTMWIQLVDEILTSINQTELLEFIYNHEI